MLDRKRLRPFSKWTDKTEAKAEKMEQEAMTVQLLNEFNKDPKSIKKAQDSAPATFVSFSLGTWRRLKTACSRRKKTTG